MYSPMLCQRCLSICCSMLAASNRCALSSCGQASTHLAEHRQADARHTAVTNTKQHREMHVLHTCQSFNRIQAGVQRHRLCLRQFVMPEDSYRLLHRLES